MAYALYCIVEKTCWLAVAITKQINAIQEGIALTMKSWEVKACGVSKSILKQFEGLLYYCKRL